MKKINSFAGYDPIKIPYADFAASLPATGCAVHDLGESSDASMRVYGLSLGDLVNKPTIYIQGQIHGAHEWRTAHWVRKFMEYLVNPPNSHKEVINRLRSKFSFYAIPCLNPPGYKNSTYYNGNGVAIDLNFGYRWDEMPNLPGGNLYKGDAVWSEPETKIVRDKILELSPLSMYCCHSWGGYSGFMVRPPQGNNAADMLVRDFFESTVLSTSIPRVIKDVNTGQDVATSPVTQLTQEIKMRWQSEVQKVFFRTRATGSHTLTIKNSVGATVATSTIAGEAEQVLEFPVNALFLSEAQNYQLVFDIPSQQIYKNSALFQGVLWRGVSLNGNTTETAYVGLQGKNCEFGIKLSQPSAYSWASTIKNKHGSRILCHAIESGAYATGTEQVRMGLNGLLLACLYSENYFQTKKQKLL